MNMEVLLTIGSLLEDELLSFEWCPLSFSLFIFSFVCERGINVDELLKMMKFAGLMTTKRF